MNMGEPVPPDYLVRNCVEKGHPTYICGGRGTLKSMNALAGIAIASPRSPRFWAIRWRRTGQWCCSTPS